MTNPRDYVVTQSKEDLGELLRLVAVFDEDGFDRLFVRDDVRAERSDAEFEGLHELLTEVITEQRRGEQLIDAGELRVVSERFDELVLLVYLDGPVSGLLITADATANVQEGLLFDHISSWPVEEVIEGA